jgi:molecular chaperone GrpE
VNSEIHDQDQAPEQAVDDAAASQTANGVNDASPEQEQDVTQAKIEAAQAQAHEYLEGWQRARAEFANYKKRVEREMKDSHSSAAGNVLKDILPAIDDFERAMSHVPENLQGDPWVGGVGMILRKLNKVLDDYDVTVVDPTGEPFDPNQHEAIGMEASDEVEAGHITATVQKGYILGDRVLRPALVKVAQ